MQLLGRVISSNEAEEFSVIERTSPDEDVIKVHRKHRLYTAPWRHVRFRERFPKRLLVGDRVGFRPVNKNGTAFAHGIRILTPEQVKECELNEWERGERARQGAEIKNSIREIRNADAKLRSGAETYENPDSPVESLLQERIERRRNGNPESRFGA
jgi:hypothetical protein